MALHVKKGDRVVVISGEDKGKKGEILSVDPKRERVIVEGVNVVTKHIAPNVAAGQNTGQKVETEAPIHASNVQLLVTVDGKEVPTRVGYERRPVTKRRADGSEYESTRSVRIARKTGKEI